MERMWLQRRLALTSCLPKISRHLIKRSIVLLPYLRASVEFSSTKARLSTKLRLNTETDPATVPVKEEDVLYTREASEASHLLTEAVGAKEALPQAMKMVCCVFTDDY